MLDVHLPHGKIKGVSEFLIHLFTITVGLLIAVQIESFVEWRHHLHLASEARTDLRVEIENNLKDLKENQPEIKMCRQKIDTDLAILLPIQDNRKVPKDQLSKFGVSTRGVAPPDTAWKTAQTTGALSYMPYEEATQYANIYQTQSALIAMEEKPSENLATLMGLMAKYHLDPKQGDLRKPTAEQASAFAEILGQMKVQIALEDTLLQQAIEVDSAFLEHRKHRENFETNVN
jgi:hypothetical protein